MKCDHNGCQNKATSFNFVEIDDSPVDLETAYCDSHHALRFPKERWIKNPKGDVCSLCAEFRWACKCDDRKGEETLTSPSVPNHCTEIL